MSESINQPGLYTVERLCSDWKRDGANLRKYCAELSRQLLNMHKAQDILLERIDEMSSPPAESTEAVEVLRSLVGSCWISDPKAEYQKVWNIHVDDAKRFLDNYQPETSDPSPVDDGGPAFPERPWIRNPGTADEAECWPGEYGCSGMSLRDWFAGRALGGMLANEQVNTASDRDLEMIPATSYGIADAMLAVRKGGAS